MSKKRVLVLLTGGTISGNVAISKAQSTEKSNPDDFGDVISQSLSKIKENWGVDVEVELQSLFDLDSSNVRPDNWTTIATAIEDRYDEFDSFIVLHGTNTMGYTAAALSFAFENINKPIILTGSQVPLGYLGSDAVTNVTNSIRMAIWEHHPVMGVFAVFGSKIISGARVKKGTDFDYDPFKSFITGSIGEIGRFIRIDEAALEKHTSYLSKTLSLATDKSSLSVKKEFDTSALVSLTEFPGMSSGLIKNLVDHHGAKAFILRAFGAGDASEHLFEGLEYLKQKKIPIVITTQAPSGQASFQVNETGKHIADNQLGIPAHDMSIESMTTKLGWLLAQRASYADINQQMITDLHGEINVEAELL